MIESIKTKILKNIQTERNNMKTKNKTQSVNSVSKFVPNEMSSIGGEYTESNGKKPGKKPIINLISFF
jgi:hypothetical protein